MIVDDVDIHWLIARQVFGPNATKADRYAVKPMVCGKLYGAGVPTLAAQVGCGIDVAEAMVNTLDAITPTLAEWSAKLRTRVQAGLVKFPIRRDPAPTPGTAPRCPKTMRSKEREIVPVRVDFQAAVPRLSPAVR